MVFKGHGLVWNGEKNSLIRFVDGIYVTDAPEDISFLTAHGYEHEGELAESQKVTKKSKKGQA